MATGSRLDSYYAGARSEYLATYLFSHFGTVSMVPRQEDIGYDLVCTIAEQPHGLQTFDHHYVVSVKSESSPDIEMLPSEGYEFAAEEPVPHTDWFFRLQVPLFLCVVDKKDNQTARIYSTSVAWFVYHEEKYQDYGGIVLKPRLDPADTRGAQLPAKKDEAKAGSKRFIYEVDLTQPIAVITAADTGEKAEIEKVKKRLRDAVLNDRVAILQARLGIPYFNWFCEGAKGETAYALKPAKGDQASLERTFTELAPALYSLAWLFKTKGDDSRFNAVVDLIKLVPDHCPHAAAWKKIRGDLGI